MISMASLYSQGIGFHSLQGSFSYVSFCLAEGLNDLGIPVHANVSCQAPDISNFHFTATDPEQLYSSALIVLDLNKLEAEMANGSICLDLPFERCVILAMNDALANFAPPPDTPLFCTHENRFHTLPGFRIPWAFGCSSRILQKLQQANRPRVRRFIANFRPTFAQPVRQALDLCLVDHLKRIVEVDSTLSDPGRWGDQHFEKLSTSIGCLAYGGYFTQDMHKTPYLAERLPPAKAQFHRDTVVLRWDSWRFWESLAAGCATVHLDFEKYGFMLPVMPVNGVHYIGIDLENISATVELLAGPTEPLRKIGEQGRQWAITNYSPLAVAKRFLNYICSEQQAFLFSSAPGRYSDRPTASPRPPQRIIIDGVFFQYYATGIARVWSELLQKWAGTSFAQNLLILDRNKTCPRITGLYYLDVMKHDYKNLESDRQMLQSICDQESATLFVSTYYTTPQTTPSLLMVHDCIPESLGADLRQPSWQEKRHAIQYAVGYCTVSGHTAKDLLRYYPHTGARPLEIIHNGVSEGFTPATPDEVDAFRLQFNITKPYYLFVGPADWYKNFKLFIDAFVELPNHHSFQVVRTRKEDGEIIHPLCNDHQAVITTGRLSDAGLRAAYTGATAFVYPSWYEGFGLPVLEAMACGCPVIAADASAIPEVAGGAALLVNPHNHNAMLAALTRIQSEKLRQSLRLAGFERVKQFSWQASAEKLKQFIRRIGETT